MNFVFKCSRLNHYVPLNVYIKYFILKIYTYRIMLFSNLHGIKRFTWSCHGILTTNDFANSTIFQMPHMDTTMICQSRSQKQNNCLWYIFIILRYFKKENRRQIIDVWMFICFHSSWTILKIKKYFNNTMYIIFKKWEFTVLLQCKVFCIHFLCLNKLSKKLIHTYNASMTHVLLENTISRFSSNSIKDIFWSYK